MSISRTIVAITWNGKSSPMDHIHFDVEPRFDWLLYDYSGAISESPTPVTHYMSIKSECKGDIMGNIYETIKLNLFQFIGFLDDDLIISVSDLNKLIFVAQIENLDVFQPSLNHDSYYSFRQFIHKPGFLIQETNWVEIMTPFYCKDIFLGIGPYFKHSISGQGIDVYLVPTIQRLLGKMKTAVVHAVQLKHARPLRTDNRVFSTGKTNLDEIRIIHEICMKIVSENSQLNSDKELTKILERRYVYGVPLSHKIQRIPRMIRNLYKLIVDASYR
jgi:hypothetical protein